MATTKREFNLDYPYNMLCDVFGVKFHHDVEINHDMVIEACGLVEGPDFIASVNYIVSILPGRCSQALELRYQRHMTGESVGSVLGVSRSRALQLCEKGLRNLRKPQYTKYIKYGGVSELFEMLMASHPEQLLSTGDGYLDLYALNLSVRTYNSLRRGGCNNIQDVVNLTLEDLLRMRNMGRRSILEVVEALSKLGLSIQSLTDEDIEWLHSER